MNFNSLRSKVIRTVSPALCVGMLIGASRLQIGWSSPAEARGFHDRAGAAVRAIPLNVPGWTGTVVDPPPAAIEVIEPNVNQTIEFVATPPAGGNVDDDHVWLGVIECRRASDMLGHFPTKCYPAYGDSLLSSRLRTWQIGPIGSNAKPTVIRGVEFEFERIFEGKAYRRIVYNFLIAPRRGFLSDMKELTEAAEDDRQRYFGGAQVQVVFTAPAGQTLPEARRDEIFSTLMRAAGPAIEVLRRGE